MPLTLKPINQLLLAALHGRLSRLDFDHWMSEIVRFTENSDKVRILVELLDFEGWDMTSSWIDLHSRTSRIDGVERIAFLGDKTWKNWMEAFRKPFKQAEIRFFAPEESAEAHAWLEAPA